VFLESGLREKWAKCPKKRESGLQQENCGFEGKGFVNRRKPGLSKSPKGRKSWSPDSRKRKKTRQKAKIRTPERYGNLQEASEGGKLAATGSATKRI